MSENAKTNQENAKIISFAEVTGREDPWWLYCEWAKREDMELHEDIEAAMERPDLRELYNRYAWDPLEHTKGLLACKLTLMTVDLEKGKSRHQTPANVALDHIYRWLYWSSMPGDEEALGTKIHPLCLLTFCALFDIPFWEPRGKRKRLRNYKIGIMADPLLELRISAKRLYLTRIMVAELPKVDLNEL